MKGAYNQFQRGEIIDQNHLLQNCLNLLNLTDQYFKKELSGILAENLIKLLGGEDGSNRRN